MNKAVTASSIDSLRGRTLLFVGPYPPPFGGVSSHLAELARSFVPTGVNFHVLHFGDKTSEEVLDGAHVHRTANRPAWKLLKALLRNPFRLLIALSLWASRLRKGARLYSSGLLQALITAEIADRVGAQTVTVYTTRMGMMVPYLRALRPHLAIFYCVFADPYKNPAFYTFHKHWYRKAVLDSNRVFASSAYCSRVVEVFSKELSADVIYIGVDTERFRPVADVEEARRKLQLPQLPIVLFVGRMEPEMGADNALEVALRVTAERDDLAFVIAGAKGALTDKVLAAAAASGGKIVCRVNVPANDLPGYYAAASVLVAPTLGAHACMGVSIKEAMASGRASVVSDSGGIPEAVRNGVDGIIVPLTERGEIDNRAFGDAVVDLLSSPARCLEYGRNARERAESVFSQDATAGKYVRLFTKGST
jgi:glycosyltransferase involved in cell wall biosynthesis